MIRFMAFNAQYNTWKGPFKEHQEVRNWIKDFGRGLPYSIFCFDFVEEYEHPEERVTDPIPATLPFLTSYDPKGDVE